MKNLFSKAAVLFLICFIVIVLATPKKQNVITTNEEIKGNTTGVRYSDMQPDGSLPINK